MKEISYKRIQVSSEFIITVAVFIKPYYYIHFYMHFDDIQHFDSQVK